MGEKNQKPRYFGTDGIRGKFGQAPLDEETIRRLGHALGEALKAQHGADDLRVAIGGDTRGSTPELSSWLGAGLEAAGVEQSFLGTVPTPTVAFAARHLGAAAGIAISASHNPFPDNGIKILDGNGYKWGPDQEAALEARLQETAPPTNDAPELTVNRPAVDAYLDSLAASISAESDNPLSGLAVALDTGNGAASPYAKDLFDRLGARVEIANDAPNGQNINEGCGSTHPQVVADMVKNTGAAVGFSFDGDADRVILADEQGNVQDGDIVLYLWGRDLKSRGALPEDCIVATSMSNLGLEVALRNEGIKLERCDVGDRNVMLMMRDLGSVLGGEQSGHIIHLGLGTTGDGLLTAVQMAHLVARSDRPLSEMASGFERYPQLIKNVRVREKPPLEGMPTVATAWRAVEEKLGDEGRLVLRYSGTEPKARIMVEGRDLAEIQALADDLAEVIRKEIGE